MGDPLTQRSDPTVIASLTPVAKNKIKTKIETLPPNINP